MSWTKASTSTGRLLYSVVILALVTMGFCIFLSTTTTADADSQAKGANLVPEATFNADPASLGAIPDSNDNSGPSCQTNSTNMRDVTFTVSGLSGSVATVSVAFSASHTYLQDLEVTLIAPSAQSLLLFSATGTTSTVANSCTGSTSDLSTANTYTFADSASANWWTTASSGIVVPTSTNRTVVSGIGGTTNPPATTSLNSAFAGATANGTWTLRFRDRGVGDTGTVTAASLTITTSAAVVNTQHVVDYNGDGKTDFSVIRNVGGGSSGQLRWYNAQNGTGAVTAFDWGLATDFFTPVDFDGDSKTDITVWRPGSPGSFFILQSQTNTVRIVTFGLTGDDPTVVGDYDGDGKADPAVYRPGATAGAQSYWFYLGSLNNPNGNITFVPWGINGDFPAPGDYNGDHKGDFVVQRNNGGGQARFYELLSNGTTSGAVFGIPTDTVVPGDYDGDGKTDIATVRGASGNLQWQYLSSIDGTTIKYFVFGSSATDFPTQGDYDGDGKTDVAIWRPGSPGQFWAMKSSDGGLVFYQLGSTGDLPVAWYNTH